MEKIARVLVVLNVQIFTLLDNYNHGSKFCRYPDTYSKMFVSTIGSMESIQRPVDVSLRIYPPVAMHFGACK